MKKMIKHVVVVSSPAIAFHVHVAFVATRHDVFAFEMYSLFIFIVYFVITLVAYLVQVYWGHVFLMAIGVIAMVTFITRSIIEVKEIY